MLWILVHSRSAMLGYGSPESTFAGSDMPGAAAAGPDVHLGAIVRPVTFLIG
jgi:hypothetical protein